MIELSKQIAEPSGRRAFAPTALLVLFALSINLLGINATLAGLPATVIGAQTQQSIAKAQSGQQSVKPCHHNHGGQGLHKPTAPTGLSLGAQADDGLCCTHDDRSGELPKALRSKRDPKWQATASPSSEFLSVAFSSIGGSLPQYIEIVERYVEQRTGLVGAGAEFVQTVRLLT